MPWVLAPATTRPEGAQECPPAGSLFSNRNPSTLQVDSGARCPRILLPTRDWRKMNPSYRIWGNFLSSYHRGVITDGMQEPFPYIPPPRRDEESRGGREVMTRRAPLDRRLRAFVVVGLLAFWTIPFLVLLSAERVAKETTAKTRVIQNLSGPIKTALMAYAADHQGQFPDAPELAGNPGPQTSNAAFRRLFEGGYLKDEKAFMVKQGAAQADGDTSAPEKILAKGENHWALAKGLKIPSDERIPLMWEAPLAGNWDPIWDSSRKRAEWGSTWSDRTVILMTVAGNVASIRIKTGELYKKGPGRLAPTEGRTNFFQRHPDGDSLGPEW